MKPSFKEYLINEAKYAGFRKPEEADFEIGKAIRANHLRRGMTVAGTYKGFIDDQTWYAEVLGFTDNKSKYGEGGVVYNSAKEMLAANNVRTFKELEALDDENEYGFHHYLVLRDLTDDIITQNDNVFMAYIYNGRWVIGSGASPVSFKEAKYVPKRRVDEASYHGHGDLPKVMVFDDPHDIENKMDDMSYELKRQIIDEELGFIEGMPNHFGYFGLFYENTRPSRGQLISMVTRILSEMHQDKNAVKFAECIVDAGSVFYGKLFSDKTNGELYCEKYD